MVTSFFRIVPASVESHQVELSSMPTVSFNQLTQSSSLVRKSDFVLTQGRCGGDGMSEMRPTNIASFQVASLAVVSHPDFQINQRSPVPFTFDA